MANVDGDITLSVNLTPGDVKTTTDALQKDIDKIFQSTDGKNISSSFKTLLTSMDKSSKKAEQLLQKMKALENTSIPNQDFAQLEKEYEKLLGQLGNLTERKNKFLATGGRTRSRAFAGIEYEIKRVSDEIDFVYNRMEQLRNAGPVATLGEDTQEYANLVAQLNSVNNQMTVYTQRARAVTEAQPDLNTGGWDRFAETVSHVSFQIGRLAVRLAGLSFRVVIRGLSAVVSRARDAVSNLVKLGSRTIINGVRRLGSALSKTNKHTKNQNDLFKKGFKFLLRYGLGIRSVYFLARKLRKALGEGIGNLAQYSDAFNRTISIFMASLIRLKNAFATAFAPIINVVAPILTAFSNAVSEAVTRLGMLIAALTGQSTFIRAKKVQFDYAKSLDGAADSADHATEAAEKYQKTIAGFDDVEILKEPTTSGNSGGGGGGGNDNGEPDPNDMFETVPIDAAFKDWAEKLKEAWETADFTEIGETIAQKLAETLNNIPWTRIQELAGKFGKSFATLINGLVSVTELATAIGATIGEAINTIFTAANAFVTNLEFDKVGAFLAEVMNSGIATINWGLIADTLSKAANGVFNLAKTWAERFNFGALGTELSNTVKNTLNALKWEDAQEAMSNIGTGLATALNNVITPSTFDSVARAIAQALNTCITGLYSLVSTIEWKQWGNAIATGINRFFATFDFVTAGLTFSEGALGILDAIKTALQGVQWSQAGEKVKEGLKAVKWNEIFTSLSEAIGMAFGGIAEFIGGLIGNGFTAAKEYFSKTIEDVGGDIPTGIFLGIIRGLGSIVDWIKTNIFTPFINGFKSIFGINSPSTVMAEQGGYIISGMLDGIINALKNIATWVDEHILTPIKNALGAGVELGISLVKSGWKTVTGWLGVAADSVVAVVNAGVGLIKSGWESLSGWLTSLPAKVKDGVLETLVNLKQGWDKLSTWLTALKDSVKTGALEAAVKLKQGWTKLTTWLSGLKDDVKTGALEAAVKLKQGWTKLSTWLSGLKDDVKTGALEAGVKLKQGWDTLKTWLSKLPENARTGALGITATLVKAWDTVAGWISKLAQNARTGALGITATLVKGWETVAGWISKLAQNARTGALGITATLVKGWDTITGWISKLAQNARTGALGITATLVQGWGTVTSWISNLPANVKSGALSISTTLSRAWGTLAKWFSTLPPEDTVANASIITNLAKTTWKSVQDWFDNLGDSYTKATAVIEAELKQDKTKDPPVLGVNAKAEKTSIDPAVNKDKKTWWNKLTGMFTGVSYGGEGDPIIEAEVSATKIGPSPKSKTSKVVSGLNAEFSKASYIGETPPVLETADVKKASVQKITYGGTATPFWKAVKATVTKISAEGDAKTVRPWFDQKATINKITEDGVTERPWTGVKATVKQISGKDAQKRPWKDVTATVDDFSDKTSDSDKPWRGVTSSISHLTDKAPKKDHEIKVTGVVQKIKHRRTGPQEANGGAFYGGSWHNIAQYAIGGIPRHGTMFVAGEAGAETVGHINGRTEVLNQSQMASVMYAAVVNGTQQLMNTITSYMRVCTNTLIANIGSLISYSGYIAEQVATLQNIGKIIDTSVYRNIDAIVTGKVIPTAINIASNNPVDTKLAKVLDLLQYEQNNSVTRADLVEILRTMFEQYMNIDFYMGDEQIAKHANLGNAKLDRRFNPVVAR